MSKHFDPKDSIGTFTKSDDYRDSCLGCGRGCHGNYWDAHHVLPLVSFTDITDDLAIKCLKITDYNINTPTEMAGLPQLKAFILHFQRDKTFPYQEKLELTTTMRRWGKIEQHEYQKLAKTPIIFPGDFPVHIPTNWGHVFYSEEVTTWVLDKIIAPIKRKYKPPAHPVPENIKAALESANKKFWGDLVAIGSAGIETHFRNRYGTTKAFWWKPMCMSAQVLSPPCSPSLA